MNSRKYFKVFNHKFRFYFKLFSDRGLKQFDLELDFIVDNLPNIKIFSGPYTGIN